MYERSLPRHYARATIPMGSGLSLPGRVRACHGSVLMRRIAQFTVDTIASMLLSTAAMALFVLLPTRTDGSIRNGALTATITGAVVLGAFAILLWYWVLRPDRHDGRTWGMQAFGIRVVDESGGRASRRQLGVRWLLLVVDAFPLGGIGLTATLTSRPRQRVGDRVARTFVIRGRGPGLD